MAKNNRERINVLKQELNLIEDNIDNIKITLSNYSTLETKLINHTAKSEELNKSIQLIHTNVVNNETSIKNIAEEIKRGKINIDSILEKIQTNKSEIDSIYDTVFGIKNSKGVREGGLEDQIKERLDEINKQQKEQQDTYDKLTKKVQDLLPKATSAGLASAYADQKRTYETPEIIWAFVAGVAMIIITIFGYLNFNEAKEFKNVTEALSTLIARLPLFFGVTWLAIYAGKQQSQNKRLQQEYAHKETLARSLEGYKREIENLSGKKSEDIINLFMEKVVEVVAFNPSDTLDKNHENKPPYIKEALEKLLPNGKENLDITSKLK